jgi:hypothetical protein
MSQSLSQIVVSALREVSNPAPVSTFVRGDGRSISDYTTITMPNGDTTLFCGLTYEERVKVLAANRNGGGRWLRDGSFQIFKNDL